VEDDILLTIMSIFNHSDVVGLQSCRIR